MVECFINRLQNAGKATFAKMVAKEAGALLDCPMNGKLVSSGSDYLADMAVMLGKAIHDACYEFEGIEELKKIIRLTAKEPNEACMTCTKCPVPIGDTEQEEANENNGKNNQV